MEHFEFPTGGIDFLSLYDQPHLQISPDQTGESLPTGQAKRENERESDKCCIGLSGGGSKFLGYQPLPEAGKHSGTFQQSEVSGGGRQKRKVSEAADIRKQRKRVNDRDYRARLKNEREQTKQELNSLTKENASLRGENDSLKEKHARMNHTLQSQEADIKQLNCGLLILNRRCEWQNNIVEALSENLSHSVTASRKNERERLKIEQSSSSSPSSSIQDQICGLLEEIAKLEREKRLLEVKVDALCEKIDNHRKSEEEEQEENLHILL